ncbi:MAG: TonB-dependent receptor [Bryobacterales bacterium]|nr:TonB-dependent receptor [Bryobacteraceae bacterium]MDW8356103.1 TonB-dependent receptor [Bryobacterales bacterium]
MTGNSGARLRAPLIAFALAVLSFGQDLPAPSSAVRSRKVCASVQDPQGFPVEGVSVSLEPLAAAAVHRGLTDTQGRWCTEAAPGVYVVRAVGREMEGAAVSTVIRPGEEELHLNLPLKISSIASQVEVTASRLPESLLEAPLPVKQVDRRQLTLIGARQLNDALQEMPEVVTFAGGQHSGGGSANVQGFGSRDVEILIDGQPLAGRVGGYVDLNQFDASFIDSIEVKTGASALTYGLQGMGGAINLVTRRAVSGSHGSTETGFGRFNTGLLRADGGYAKGGFAVYAAGALQRGLGFDLDPSTLAKTQPSNRVRNLFSSLYLPSWRNWNFGITAMWLDHSFWGVDGSNITEIYDFVRPKKRLILLPRASYSLGGSSLLMFRGRRIYYRANEDVFYRMPYSARIQKTENEASGADAEWSLARPGGLRISSGVFFNRLSMTGDRLSTAGNYAERDVWSQLSTSEIPLFRTLRLLAGYRADHDSHFGGRFSPQGALSWRPVSWLSLSGGATRGIRAPDFNEMYIFHTHAGGRVRIYGEPALLPQESWSYHAGALVNLSARTRLETRLFHHDMENLIQTRFLGTQGMAMTYRYANIGEARIRGGSASLLHTWNRRLEFSAGYQYLDTLNRIGQVPLEYAPRHRGHFRLTWSDTRRGLLASFFGNASSATYFGTSGGARLFMDGFELLGVNVQKDITPRIALRATFRNLTDDVNPAFRLTAPFSAETSLKIRLGRIE